MYDTKKIKGNDKLENLFTKYMTAKKITDTKSFFKSIKDKPSTEKKGSSPRQNYKCPIDIKNSQEKCK